MTKHELKVLLVEDNPSDAYLVRELLSRCEKRKYVIEEAHNLNEAIGHLKKSQYDAVLLDLSLPDSIGLQTFDKVRHAACDIPIVVCSGTSDMAFATKAVQHGAQDYVVKGKFDQHLLSRAIEYAIERQALLIQLRVKNEELEKSEHQQRSIIENNADGMMILGLDGRVRFVNPAAESLFNTLAPELAEKKLPELIAQREQRDYDLSDLCGEARYAEVRTELIVWEGETSWLASLRDITQRKKDEAD
ncbi:MAG: response regulator, partial [Chlorobiales bacterium]|nr:response regulator [Chlorobiales bacterium]